MSMILYTASLGVFSVFIFFVFVCLFIYKISDNYEIIFNDNLKE